MSTPAAIIDVVSPSPTTEVLHQLHDAAQPLTVLQGLLELALLTPATPEEYRIVLQRAIEQSRRISINFEQLRRLLTVSSVESTHLAPISESRRIERVHV